MTGDRNKVIMLAGATASGKSGIGVRLAELLDGEIVNCDSMQIYKYLDIGTGKPNAEERRGIPHHLMGVIDPHTVFSVAEYKKMAEVCIADILSRGKQPIVVGGTGLYVNALVYNIEYQGDSGGGELRAKLKKQAVDEGTDSLYNKLAKVDSQAAARIDPHDQKRIIRALELIYTTGESILVHEERSRKSKPIFDYYVFSLMFPREILYERINKRVELMLDNGLLDETEYVLNMRLPENSTAAKAIAYKEMATYLRGEADLIQAAELLKQKTRNYAKRQLTWFRKYGNVTEISAYNKTADEICFEIIDIYRKG